MKKHFLGVLLLALVALSGSASAQDKTKIGIIEIAAFRSEIAELRVKYEKLQSEFAPMQRELESMATSIEAKQKALQEGKNLTPQQAARLQDEIQSLQKDAQRKQEDGQATAAKREQDETSALYEKVSKFLEQYCTQKGITQVLEAGKLRESGMVIYATQAAFITDDFVKEYNKANPVAAAAK